MKTPTNYKVVGVVLCATLLSFNCSSSVRVQPLDVDWIVKLWASVRSDSSVQTFEPSPVDIRMLVSGLFPQLSLLGARRS